MFANFHNFATIPNLRDSFIRLNLEPISLNVNEQPPRSSLDFDFKLYFFLNKKFKTYNLDVDSSQSLTLTWILQAIKFLQKMCESFKKLCKKYSARGYDEADEEIIDLDEVRNDENVLTDQDEKMQQM
ncbi:hypothetical protein BpHYR1_045369 [Brachionus plicatilis]|uniref:Uncharacterized protein n=1 Tax=Brachionus plicatilis TaxID=10195 RepID=A0A3M7S839_BRAPC|nr:hypothetical protein BpHYR1_045369 [Brachionus plicatilis]